MLGPAIRRCLSSGQWSGNIPSCKRVTMGWWLLRLTVNILAFLRLTVKRVTMG